MTAIESVDRIRLIRFPPRCADYHESCRASGIPGARPACANRVSGAQPAQASATDPASDSYSSGGF